MNMVSPTHALTVCTAAVVGSGIAEENTQNSGQFTIKKVANAQVKKTNKQQKVAEQTEYE